MTNMQPTSPRRRRVVSWGAYALAALCSCGPQRLAGTATETTNGYAMLSSGTPAADAAVRLVDVRGWVSLVGRGATPVIESTTTDAQGRFTLHSRPSGECNLQIDTKEEGALVSGVEAMMGTSDDTISCGLQPYATVNGAVDTTMPTVGEVLFGGSTYKTSIGPGNSFAPVKVPHGTIPLITQSGTDAAPTLAFVATLDVTAAVSVDAGTVSGGAAIVPVEDFSHGWDRTNLGRVVGGGYWFAYSDTVSPYAGSSFIKTEIVYDSAASIGNSLQATMILRAGFNSPFAGFGFHLGDPNSVYNCSTLRTLSFMAKGSGVVRVAFKTALSDDVGALVAIPQTWTKIEVSVDSLKASSTSTASSWAAMAGRVDRVEFSVLGQFRAIGDTVSLALDNIQLEGVTLQTLAQ